VTRDTRPLLLLSRRAHFERAFRVMRGDFFKCVCVTCDDVIKCVCAMGDDVVTKSSVFLPLRVCARASLCIPPTGAAASFSDNAPE
jgi:hypothetical protein